VEIIFNVKFFGYLSCDIRHSNFAQNVRLIISLICLCESALEEACKCGHLDIVQVLIDRGADVDLKTEVSR